MTITYDVTIDAGAATTPQMNIAEVCVAELPDCDTDDETVTPECRTSRSSRRPVMPRTARSSRPSPATSTYTYVVTNTGPLPLDDVTVTDDNGTPADTGDDFEATCPKTTLAVDESMDLHGDGRRHGRHDQRRGRRGHHRRGQSGRGRRRRRSSRSSSTAWSSPSPTTPRSRPSSCRTAPPRTCRRPTKARRSPSPWITRSAATP